MKKKGFFEYIVLTEYVSKLYISNKGINVDLLIS